MTAWPPHLTGVRGRSDKREVLFASEDELRDITVHALADVPSDLESLCARVGMDTFSTAIHRWSTQPVDLHSTLDQTFQELRGLSAALKA